MHLNSILEKRPLVTFFLIAYNQEKCVHEAIKSAFSQSYSPLEIILSDDCSPDGTFRIMEEMAAGYKGPHQIILNRNSKNFGIVEHVNKVIELSGGVLIVAAAGDDISLSDRVERTVNLWNKHDQKHDLLYFNYEPFGTNPYTYIVDPENHELNYQIKKGGAHLKGATAAFTKRLFDLFGPIQSWVYAEDKSIPFRAAIRGGIICDDVPVIRYRMDAQNDGRESKAALRNFRLKELKKRQGYYEGFLVDLNTLQQREPGSGLDYDSLIQQIGLQMTGIHRQMKLFSEKWLDRYIGIFYVCVEYTWQKFSFRKKASMIRDVLFFK